MMPRRTHDRVRTNVDKRWGVRLPRHLLHVRRRHDGLQDPRSGQWACGLSAAREHHGALRQRDEHLLRAGSGDVRITCTPPTDCKIGAPS